MCTTCGCGVENDEVRVDGQVTPARTRVEAVTVLESLLADNDAQASHNRKHFDAHEVLVINLMSSPGAGKTALLEATIQAMGDELRMAVIEGDLETENDAERIRRHGVPAIQIATGSACHLDAHMVHDALHQLDLSTVDIVFIENVGNLVCPASFDLGQHSDIVLLSVPEGDDKPAKYPVMFRTADMVMLSKADLLPVLDDFNPARAEQYLRNLANPAPLIHTSAKSGDGMESWLQWLRETVSQHQLALQAVSPAHAHEHKHDHVSGQHRDPEHSQP